MQNLLAPGSKFTRRLEGEPTPPVEHPKTVAPLDTEPVTAGDVPSTPLPIQGFDYAKSTVGLSETQMGVLKDVQGTLAAYGITSEMADIVQAMVGSLTARPALCRGLVAAYLLERQT